MANGASEIEADELSSAVRGSPGFDGTACLAPEFLLEAIERERGPSLSPGFDLSAAVTTITPPASTAEAELIPLRSDGPLIGSATLYVTDGASDQEREVWIPLPQGALEKIAFSLSEQPGVGSVTFTARIEGVDQAATAITLSGSGTTGAWSGSISVANNARLAIKAALTNMPAFYLRGSIVHRPT